MLPFRILASNVRRHTRHHLPLMFGTPFPSPNTAMRRPPAGRRREDHQRLQPELARNRSRGDLLNHITGIRILSSHHPHLRSPECPRCKRTRPHLPPSQSNPVRNLRDRRRRIILAQTRRRLSQELILSLLLQTEDEREGVADSRNRSTTTRIPSLNPPCTPLATLTPLPRVDRTPNRSDTSSTMAVRFQSRLVVVLNTAPTPDRQTKTRMCESAAPHQIAVGDAVRTDRLLQGRTAIAPVLYRQEVSRRHTTRLSHSIILLSTLKSPLFSQPGQR